MTKYMWYTVSVNAKLYGVIVFGLNFLLLGFPRKELNTCAGEGLNAKRVTIRRKRTRCVLFSAAFLASFYDPKHTISAEIHKASHTHASRANKSAKNDMTRAKEKGGVSCDWACWAMRYLSWLHIMSSASQSRLLRSCWRFWSGARDNWRGHSSITIYGSYRAPTAPHRAGVFAWTRFIRPTSFISSIDWISSSQQQRNAAFRAHHTPRIADTGQKIHISALIYGNKKIPSACCPCPWIISQRTCDPLRRKRSLSAGAFWFCRRRGDLSHLTLLYGASAPFSYITLCRSTLMNYSPNSMQYQPE